MRFYYKVVGKKGDDSYILGFTFDKVARLKYLLEKGWKKTEIEFIKIKEV
jgi:hypothetical protein